MIILLKTTRECFDTLTNIFKKKSSIQEHGHIQSKVVYTKEENLVLVERLKKGRKPFTTKKFIHSSEYIRTSVFSARVHRSRGSPHKSIKDKYFIF